MRCITGPTAGTRGLAARPRREANPPVGRLPSARGRAARPAARERSAVPHVLRSGGRVMTRPVALVTGGTRGIGLGIARALAGRGYDLALSGQRDGEDVAAAAVRARSERGWRDSLRPIRHRVGRRSRRARERRAGALRPGRRAREQRRSRAASPRGSARRDRRQLRGGHRDEPRRPVFSHAGGRADDDRAASPGTGARGRRSCSSRRCPPRWHLPTAASTA